MSNIPGAGEFTGKSINISKADGINAAWLYAALKVRFGNAR